MSFLQPLSVGSIKAPKAGVELLLYRLFHIIRKIAEEIDARARLQLIDGDGILSQPGILYVVLQRDLREPKGYAVIEIALLAQQRHKEITGYDKSVA